MSDDRETSFSAEYVPPPPPEPGRYIIRSMRNSRAPWHVSLDELIELWTMFGRIIEEATGSDG